MENRDGHDESTKFFIGTEVEHTPAYGQRTLFVVGLQPTKEILARALNNNCPHIYMGANQSFDPKTSEDYMDWDHVITPLLKEGIWVTLDYDIGHQEEVIESGFNEYNNFISIISAKVPHIDLLNYNAIIKIDDKGFKASNPGVWCHSVHDLQKRDVYTDWTKYTKDEVIK